MSNVGEPFFPSECARGLTNRSGSPHAFESPDGYHWRCPCGAHANGTRIDFAGWKDVQGEYILLDSQLKRLIDAGLRVPPEMKAALDRRLAGPQ